MRSKKQKNKVPLDLVLKGFRIYRCLNSMQKFKFCVNALAIQSVVLLEGYHCWTNYSRVLKESNNGVVLSV